MPLSLPPWFVVNGAATRCDGSVDIVLEAVNVLGLRRRFVVELQATMGNKRPTLRRVVLFGHCHADFHGLVLLLS
jgi:hypothetical protein